MVNNQYLVILALLIITIFCVMTSGSVLVVNAQSPPDTGGVKTTKEVSSSSKSTDDSAKSEIKVTTVNEPKNPDPVKPLTDAPIIKSKTANKDDVKKALDGSSKDVKDTLGKLVKGKDKIGGSSNNNTKPTPVPFPKNGNNKLPKNCSSQFDKNTNNTLIICDKTIVKVIKGPTHTIVKTQTTTPVNKNNYYYSYPQTPAQLNYGSSLSANLAMYGTNGAPATYLLLLDSKQLCLIAGDTQCVALQDKFMTSSITTIYDSSAKEWTITGTVKDVTPDKLNDIQVTALFYDGKGNTIGNNAITAKVSPSKIDSFEDGVFSFKTNVKDDLNGKNPVFIVLNYSNDKNSVQSSSSNNNNKVGPTIGTHQTTHGVPY